MNMNPYISNPNNPNSSPYTSDGYEKRGPIKLLLIVGGILATIAIIFLIVHFSGPTTQQSKYIKSATAAARKQIPSAEVSEVKVAGDFAVAHVSDPAAEGQAAAGNQTYFKLNKDGSMALIASGSSFSPVDLSGLGIPLAVQAQLTGRGLAQSQQDLAAACGYMGGNEPGYVGFGGSFDPGDWQIDAGTLSGIAQALTSVLSNKNAQAKFAQKVICVNATRGKSSASTNQQTYISAYGLNLQFINGSGTVTSHPFTFAVGPKNYRTYTLDGKILQAR